MAAQIPPDHQSAIATRLWSLFVDRVTAAAVARLDEVGIRSILLKGPVFAALLYADGAERAYTDTDLLLSISNLHRAENRLQGFGFVRVDRDEDWLGPEPKYAHTYWRPLDGALIDLHWSLSGATAPPAQVWSVLTQQTETLELDGRPVEVMNATSSAMLVALHSAHHGHSRSTTSSDLDRAVDQLDVGVWRDAARLAEQVAAARSFAAGLRLTAEGDALADRLGLARPNSVEMWLKTHPSTYGAYVLDRLAQTPTVRGRMRLALQVAFPPRVVMRTFFPLARRGPAGLALAWVIRPVRLLTRAPSALRDWSRAQRSLRRSA